MALHSVMPRSHGECHSLKEVGRGGEQADGQQAAALFALAIQLQVDLPPPARHRLYLQGQSSS
jgi:hypothetical protein